MVETHSFSGSEALTKGTYDPAAKVLTLWFTSSPHKAYRYMQVPPQVWMGLKSASSAGGYVRLHIQGKYSTLP